MSKFYEIENGVALRYMGDFTHQNLDNYVEIVSILNEKNANLDINILDTEKLMENDAVIVNLFGNYLINKNIIRAVHWSKGSNYIEYIIDDGISGYDDAIHSKIRYIYDVLKDSKEAEQSYEALYEDNFYTRIALVDSEGEVYPIDGSELKIQIEG